VNAERYQQVCEIFDRVRDLGPEERETTLVESCGGDSELAEEVRSLLTAEKKAEKQGFLDTEIFGCSALSGEIANHQPTEVSASQGGYTGRRVGHILLKDVVGSGGMGIVYRGVDEKLGREVAVKVVGESQRFDDAARSRFLREAQLLSQLDHGGICRVYDYVEGGESDFLVLELIDGTSLREALKVGIPHQQALRIAEQLSGVLCEAHSRGVTHRDLKPENVMLDKNGEVKVLDFGLARHEGDGRLTGLDKTRVASEPVAGGADRTAIGAVLGTIGYMSPEQARGEPASPPSDIYALGLLFQELFAGQKPFDTTASPFELLKRSGAGESEPVRGLGADLTQLFDSMKSAQPQDRPSAPQVNTVVRSIIGKPRRRLRMAAIIVGALMVVSASIRYAVDLHRERMVALQASIEAAQARGDAEELMGFMVEDLFSNLKLLGRLDLLKQVSEKALDYYGPESTEAMTTQEVHRRTMMLRNLGSVFTAEGDLSRARQAFDSAIALARRAAGGSPADLRLIDELSQSFQGLASVEIQQDNPDAAVAAYEQALGYSRIAASSDPENLQWRRSLARSYSSLGGFLHTMGRHREALGPLRRAVAENRRLLEEDPSSLELMLDLAGRYRILSQVQAALGDVSAAGSASERDLELVEGVVGAAEDNVHARAALMQGYTWSGYLAEQLGDTERALRSMHRAVDIGEYLVRSDPTNYLLKFRLSATYDHLGEVVFEAGGHDEALEAFEKALELMKICSARDETNNYFLNDLAHSYLQFGRTQQALGRRGRAREAWRRGAEIAAIASRREGAPPLQETYGRALLYLGRVDEARPVIERVLDSGWHLDRATKELCEIHGVPVDGQP